MQWIEKINLFESYTYIFLADEISVVLKWRVQFFILNDDIIYAIDWLRPAVPFELFFE